MSFLSLNACIRSKYSLQELCGIGSHLLCLPSPHNFYSFEILLNPFASLWIEFSSHVDFNFLNTQNDFKSQNYNKSCIHRCHSFPDSHYSFPPLLKVINFINFWLTLPVWFAKISRKSGMFQEFACHPCSGAILIFSVWFQF